MSEIRTRVRTSYHLGDSETSIAAGVGSCLVPSREDHMAQSIP